MPIVALYAPEGALLMSIERGNELVGNEATGGTMSFESAPPANLYAARGLNPRVKVNSTRQGTPRPFGPWTPGFVAKANDTKSNEHDSDSAAHLDADGNVDSTMEYRGLAALAQNNGPMAAKSLAPRVPRFGQKQRSPNDAVMSLVRETAPIAPANEPPVATINQAREPFARARINVPMDRLDTVVVSPALVPPVVVDHRAEAVVAFMLFMAILGLVHLIWSTP